MGAVRRVGSSGYGRIGYMVSISKFAFLVLCTNCVDHSVARLTLATSRARLILMTKTAQSSTLIGQGIVWLF